MLDDAQLAQMFLRKGLVDATTLKKAEKMCAELSMSLYSVLLENEMVDEERAVVEVSKHLNLHCVSLREFEANPEILELIPFEMAQTLRLMPLGLTEEEGEFKLYVAMANPLDLDAIESVGQQVEYPIAPLLAGPVDVDQAITRSYEELGKDTESGGGGGALNEGLGDMLDGLFEGGLGGLGLDDSKPKDKKDGGQGFSIDLDLDLNVGGDKKKSKNTTKEARHTRATLPSGVEIPREALKAEEKSSKKSSKPTLPAGTERPMGLKGEPLSTSEGAPEGFNRKKTSPGTQAIPAEAAAETSGFGDWGLDFDLGDGDDDAAASPAETSSMGRRMPSATSRSENSSIRYVADPNLRRSADFPGNIPVSDLIWATVRLLVKKGLLTEDEIKEEVKKKRARGKRR